MERSNRRLANHTGLNLIRLIIGSYFMAISLGLVQGVDHRAIFAPIFGLQTGDLIGTTVLFAISAAFMSGLYLRTTSLMLALFVLTSSLIETFMPFQPQNISAFWRDLTLMCGVLLSYYSLKPADMQRASLVGRRYISRVVKTSEQVTPRRVTPSVAGKAAKTAENRMPLQVTDDTTQPRVPTGLSKSNRPSADQTRNRQKPTNPAAVAGKDVTNIFVES